MKQLIAMLTAIAAALFVSSCTSPASEPHSDHDHGSQSAQTPANNAADVMFATNMIPHHEQAVALSELVPSRSSDPAVVELAAAISAEQSPEIDTMKGFLAEWDGGADPGHDGHDMAAMDGMVDDATMKHLESLKGKEFDTLWLKSMIGHHEGAIEMANTEIADGANGDAKTLAEQIVKAQTDEIDQMKNMLGG